MCIMKKVLSRMDKSRKHDLTKFEKEEVNKMKKITRTIETHTINSATVTMEDGKIVTTPLEPISISNVTMNNEKALKLVRKKYGKTGNYVITGIDTEKVTYGLPFEKFMELADVISGNEKDEDEDETEE